MNKVLTLNETEELIRRGILAENVRIHINRAIRPLKCEVMIDKIFQLNGDVRFLVSSMDDNYNYNIGYREISKIDSMDIQSLLEAYEIGEAKITEIFEKTDVSNDVIKQEEATINGIILDEGMKFIFHNDANEKFNNKVLTVRYDNEGLLKLVGNRGRPRKNQD